MTTKDTTKILSRYPNTRYMGSKRKLIPTIAQIVSQLNPTSVLDAFAGSGCVAYLFKEMGLQVTSNDFLKFSYHIANASIANSFSLIKACIPNCNPERAESMQK